MARTCLAALALLALSALGNGGCAAMFASGPDRIPVESDPPGARVYLDGAYQGVTPVTVEVPRASEAEFSVKKEGYAGATVDRDKVLNGWFLASILVWPIGLPVDLLTHNQGRYRETPVRVALERQAGAVVASQGGPSVAQPTEEPELMPPPPYPAPADPAQRKRIAVLEFGSEEKAGLTQFEAEALADDVRASALELGPRYSVMTRENMLELLPPGTDLAQCSEGQCEVEAGRKVGADFVVAGQIGRFADEYELRVKLFDAASAALLSQRSARGKDLKALRDATSRSSRRLFRPLWPPE
jgi:TolB-like protein